MMVALLHCPARGACHVEEHAPQIHLVFVRAWALTHGKEVPQYVVFWFLVIALNI